MSATVTELKTKMEDLSAELDGCENSKASGLRARKLTNDLTKLMKTFRSENVDFHKKSD